MHHQINKRIEPALKVNLFPALVVITMLTGCGSRIKDGGEGGGGGVPLGIDLTVGTASTQQAAIVALQGNEAMSMPYIAPNENEYSSLGAAHTLLNGGLNPIAARDTLAEDAWVDGWTGLNVSVGIVDGFNGNNVVDSHGDWVATVVQTIAPEATLNLKNIDTDPSNYIIAEPLQNSPENFVESLSTELAFEAFQELVQGGVPIINNSYGREREDYDTSSEFDTAVAGYISSYDPESTNLWQQAYESLDALFVWAAGNGAETCETLVSSRRLEDCNRWAAYVAGVRSNGNVIGLDDIWVGALQDGSDLMTDYSNHAGALANDFIVANDDVLAAGDGAGTSFAAPRVAGAAALVKQKFPNLTSQQLKKVLLQTATDLGVEGVDEIYGHGKLNIRGALSPYGKLSD